LGKYNFKFNYFSCLENVRKNTKILLLKSVSDGEICRDELLFMGENKVKILFE